MTNYECIMLGLELSTLTYSDAEVDNAVDAMVAAGWVVAAEAIKIKAVAKRAVLIRKARFPYQGA